MPDETGQIAAVTLWSSSVKVIIGIAASVACAFIVGTIGWAVMIDRQNVRISFALENIKEKLDSNSVVLNVKLLEVAAIEKRVTLLEFNARNKN